MINIFKLLFILLIFSSCTIDRDKDVDREKFLFSTGDDSEIFFRNIRASDYIKEERKETRWEIYRHEDFYKNNNELDINIAIILNVIQDQAYLYVEPGERLKELDPLTVYATERHSKIKDTIELRLPNREGMLEFATQLYESLQKNKDLMIILNGDSIPILNDHDRREAYRKTMADYYRLVRIF